MCAIRHGTTRTLPMSMCVDFDDVKRPDFCPIHIFFLVLPSNPSLNQSRIGTPGTWLSLDALIFLQFFSTLGPRTKMHLYITPAAHVYKLAPATQIQPCHAASANRRSKNWSKSKSSWASLCKSNLSMAEVRQFIIEIWTATTTTTTTTTTTDNK